MSLVHGADGCPSGWVVATLDRSTRAVSVELATTETLHLLPGTMAIDMPIGLLDASDRPCDRAARRLLSPAGSRIFPSPSRAVLDARSYEEATALQRASDGKGLSRQTYAILPRIRELDHALVAAPTSIRERVHETHPELTFRRLTEGASLRVSKHTPEGIAMRIAALGDQVDGVHLAAALVKFRRKDAKPDDVLDAVACALAAERIVLGTVEYAGDPDARDACGLPVRIAF